ncbi:hypothetical protein [Terricaulis sp.]|uniref:hypothetical protein n=1 Tax=Terricaulis sp. TaxID=2768686 RepID=UPI003784A542
MKKFLAVYTGSTAARERSGFDKLNEADRKKLEKDGIAAWMAWGERHKAAIVFNGGPLGKTKRTGLNGVTDIKNNLAGYVVVQADSHEAAAKMFEGHPHFAMFPGEAVEIVEMLPLPQ